MTGAGAAARGGRCGRGRERARRPRLVGGDAASAAGLGESRRRWEARGVEAAGASGWSPEAAAAALRPVERARVRGRGRGRWAACPAGPAH